jgi:hypothetical protein
MGNKGQRGGKQPGAGRPKGAKDKISRNLKQLVLEAADELKRENKSLAEEAKKDPKWFYQNFLKPMLPKEVNVDLDGELDIDGKWTVEIVEPK